MQLISRVRMALASRWYHAIGKAYLRGQGVVAGTKPTLFGLPIISRAPSSSVTIGDRVVLCSDSRFTALGVNHAVILRTLRRGAEIRLGNDVGLSGTVICAAQRVEIGNNGLIGANVTITDTDFHPLDPHGRRYSRDESKIRSAPVRIEDNVFVGAGSTILKGVTIGANSVIGAGSVVTASIPPNVVAAGNPCRPIKSLVAADEFDGNLRPGARDARRMVLSTPV